MIKNEDIEIYLDKCGFPYERLEEGIWKVDVPEDRVQGIVVSHEPPLLILEIRLMRVPEGADAAFFRRLLEANVQDVPQGAFGIEDEYVLLLDRLQSETLDLGELKASIQSLSFSVVQYYKEYSQPARA
jgi:Tir chaperone family protein CesT